MSVSGPGSPAVGPGEMSHVYHALVKSLLSFVEVINNMAAKGVKVLEEADRALCELGLGQLAGQFCACLTEMCHNSRDLNTSLHTLTDHSKQGVLRMLAVFIDYQVRVVQSTAHKLSSLLNTDVCGSCLAKYLPENHQQSRGRLETTALNTGKTGRDVGREKEGESGSSSRASNAKSQSGAVASTHPAGRGDTTHTQASDTQPTSSVTAPVNSHNESAKITQEVEVTEQQFENGGANMSTSSSFERVKKEKSGPDAINSTESKASLVSEEEMKSVIDLLSGLPPPRPTLPPPTPPKPTHLPSAMPPPQAGSRMAVLGPLPIGPPPTPPKPGAPQYMPGYTGPQQAPIIQAPPPHMQHNQQAPPHHNLNQQAPPPRTASQAPTPNLSLYTHHRSHSDATAAAIATAMADFPSNTSQQHAALQATMSHPCHFTTNHHTSANHIHHPPLNFRNPGGHPGVVDPSLGGDALLSAALQQQRQQQQQQMNVMASGVDHRPLRPQMSLDSMLPGPKTNTWPMRPGKQGVAPQTLPSYDTYEGFTSDLEFSQYVSAVKQRSRRGKDNPWSIGGVDMGPAWSPLGLVYDGNQDGRQWSTGAEDSSNCSDESSSNGEWMGPLGLNTADMPQAPGASQQTNMQAPVGSNPNPQHPRLAHTKHVINMEAKSTNTWPPKQPWGVGPPPSVPPAGQTWNTIGY